VHISVYLLLKMLVKIVRYIIKCEKTPWPESESELYRPSGRRLSAKLVTTFAERGRHVVSVTYPYCLILGFLDRFIKLK
jgi:hypothetical protein